MIMEEIKIGEYIRTKIGTIKKIIKIDEHLVTVGHGMQDWHYYCKFDKGNKLFAETYEELQQKLQEVIKTHSFNLIDLIEVGDFVNEKKITCITSYQGEKELVYEENTGGGICCYIRLKDIKSIVTKEQFENMEYRIESEVN